MKRQKQIKTLNFYATVPEFTRERTVEIPKYLKRRKLELLRKKILERKYGYFFYRSVISKILPSVAEKKYKKLIARKAFLKLKWYWFEEKVQWRLILRANLHYKFTLKRNTLCKWQYAVVRTKEKTIKLNIANTHYHNKIKKRYYVCLKYARLLNKRQWILVNATHKYAVYLFLTINILAMTCIYYDLKIDYLLLLKCIAFKNRMLKVCFQHIRFYTETQIVKRNNQELVKLFQKLKYNPENIRPYFEEWQNFVHILIIKRLKCEIAQQYSNNKLLHLYLLKLYTYKQNRMIKIKNKKFAEEFYIKSIKLRTLKRWINFMDYKIQKRYKTDVTNQFYKQKLKRNCFSKLNTHKMEHKRLKLIFSTLQKNKNLRLTQQYFLELKKYVLKRQEKKQKYNSACRLYDQQVMNKYFTLLSHYVKSQKCKQMEFEKTISVVKKRMATRTLINHFKKWKMYINISSEKKLKITLADDKYNDNLVRRFFWAWKKFIDLKKVYMQRYQIIHTKYLKKLVIKTFNNWGNYIEEKKMYKSLPTQAKRLHHESLLRSGIKLILTAAFEKQKAKQDTALQGMKQQVSIALKYFKTWKRKALFTHSAKRLLNEKLKTSNKSDPNEETFDYEWNPFCFEQPRVPEYLKSSLPI